MTKKRNHFQLLEKYLPSPFSIAFILTAVSILLALIFTKPQENSTFYLFDVLKFWEKGFWELLSFTMQMALILLLGHVLAISPIMERLASFIVRYCETTAKASLIVSILTILISFINWGMCLVVGAVFVRKIGENAQSKGLKINYPLVGTAGYVGMMTWHGGFSGSAPLVVSQPGHFLETQLGVISISKTILSPMNLIAFSLCLIIIPLVFFYLGKRLHKEFDFTTLNLKSAESSNNSSENGASIDYKQWPSLVLGGVIIVISLWYLAKNPSDLSFINLNYINFLLFGLGVLFHGNFHNFLKAVEKAISGISGIIIQFPLYAGIMGIMKYSGLILVFSDFFVAISSENTFPIFTFLSGALVNTFVPSGGGQWAVQGPILIEAANTLNVSTSKTVMALAYGDQLTNMLQPFWALPLLGITKLKAHQILPYSLMAMLVGFIIYSTVLIIF